MPEVWEALQVLDEIEGAWLWEDAKTEEMTQHAKVRRSEVLGDDPILCSWGDTNAKPDTLAVIIGRTTVTVC